MNYIMKSGIIYAGDKALARLKNDFTGSKRKICSMGGEVLLSARVVCTGEEPGDVRSHRYVMVDADGGTVGAVNPEYAEEERPEVNGWPVCRLPKVESARGTICGRLCTLFMQDSRNYRLSDDNGNCLVLVVHRGIMSGWDISDFSGFPPEVLCGIFVFCRYIAQENEFIIV